jgi:hypothetical protein
VSVIKKQAKIRDSEKKKKQASFNLSSFVCFDHVSHKLHGIWMSKDHCYR